MELLSIEDVNEAYLFYEDQRSCKNWIRKNGISLIKLGKKYFINKDDFEMIVIKKLNNGKPIEDTPSKSIKHNYHNEYEHKLKADLMFKINRL